ncbi:MAG: hypothetical protein JNM41_14075 [Flavipsychrobacter sp.]|nr:hypothetical protein [Flavipsychrobacter sp.]
MKKLIPMIAVAALATMFTSCKKDYSCTCTSSASGSTTSTMKYPLGKQKKKDAESACKAMNTNVTAGSMTASVSCTLD